MIAAGEAELAMTVLTSVPIASVALARVSAPLVKGLENTIKARAGKVAGAISEVLNKASDKLKNLFKKPDSNNSSVKEGIYEFKDSTGKTYVGQSKNIPERLKQHANSGKFPDGTSVKRTEVLGGKTTREVAEHKRIQQITGGVPARRSPLVSNKVDPIGPSRRHLLE